MASKHLIPKAVAIDVPEPPPITPLDFIKQVILNINAQISSLDEELAKASTGEAGHLRALFDSVHEIKSRADQSEKIIGQIISDPALTASSEGRVNNSAKMYERLNALIATINELDKELKEAEFDYYRTVAELLADAQEQMSRFDQYSALPHVSSIKLKLDAIENELRRQVQWSFREIGSLTSNTKYPSEISSDEVIWNMDISSIAQISLVIDALGGKFRDDLLQRFAQLQLISYEKLFANGTKHCGLTSLDQRFAWFEYLLQMVEANLSSMIPAKWQLPFYLYQEFARRSRQHLAAVLESNEKEDPNPNADIALIIKAIKSVNSFEVKMQASFNNREKTESSTNDISSNKVITEFIKDAFDPYLGAYVMIERKGLEDLLSQVMQGEETPIPKAGEHPESTFNPAEPYDSSKQVFEYIKASLKRCTGFSTGLTFLSLSKEFRAALQQYADSVKARCPPPEQPARKPPVYRINKTMEKTLCRVVCTGEYCIDTLPALETIMKQRIQEKYKTEVDFTSTIEVFQDLVSFAMNILATGEIQRMEPHIATMKSVNWSSFDDVGDVHDHIKKMLLILTDCIPRIRLTMSPAYFQNFCIKVVTIFLDWYLETIWKLKRISKTGGGQLLMDTYGIKEYLVKMPNVKTPEGKDPLTIGKPYLKFVEKKLGRIENILKLICVEDSTIDEMFGVLLPDVTSREKDQILVLKGMKLVNLNAVQENLKIDQVGQNIKKGVDEVQGKLKSGANDAMSKINTGFVNVQGQMKSAFGDIFSGNLFSDTSTHSETSGHGPSNSSHTAAHSAAPGKKEMKGAVAAVIATNNLQNSATKKNGKDTISKK